MEPTIVLIMRLSYTFIISLLLLPLFSNGQSSDSTTVRLNQYALHPIKKHMVGIDAVAMYYNVASNFTTYKNHRFALTYSYSLEKNCFVDTELGFHTIASDSLQKNVVNYTNQGLFGKALIGFQTPLQHLRIGGGLGVSSINQTGYYRIGGEFFQPHESDLSNKQITAGIIIYLGSKWRVYKNLFIGVDFELYTGSWQANNNTIDKIYSMPGYLFAGNGDFAITGFDPSIKILYNFN